MKKEDVGLLIQLVQTLEEVELKMENFYEGKDAEKFNKAKKLILQIQNKIDEVSR